MADTRLALRSDRATIRHLGAVLTWEVLSRDPFPHALAGPRLVIHNGYVQALAAHLPADTREGCWRVHLEHVG
jgi:hypothetical protein